MFDASQVTGTHLQTLKERAAALAGTPEAVIFANCLQILVEETELLCNSKRSGSAATTAQRPAAPGREELAAISKFVEALRAKKGSK